MIHLDIRTTTLISSGLAWLIGIFMWLLHRRFKAIRGLFFWSIGFVVTGIAMGLFFTTGFTPLFFHLVMANITMSVGHCFLVNGIWDFKEKPTNWLIIGLIFLTMLFSTLIFVYILPDVRWRRFFYSLVVVIYGLVSAREFFTGIPKGLRFPFYFNGVVSLVVVAGMMIRGYLSLMEPQTDLMGSSLANNITFSVVISTQVALSLGIILMVTYRIMIDLELSMASKNLIYSILAHDLKSPVAGIMQLSELIRDKDIREDKKEIALERISKLSESVYAIMENLLEWSRNQGGEIRFQPTRLNMSEVIQSAVELLHIGAQRKRIRLVNKTSENLMVYADAHMISVVIRNLIANAVKYSNSGSKVMISGEFHEQLVRIYIEDQGVGISPEKVKLIQTDQDVFSTHGTANEIGTGLGLKLCRDFLQRNHGCMQIESQENVGTKVILELPVA